MPGHTTQLQLRARSNLAGLFASGSEARALWDNFLDLVFPPRCAGCDRIDTRWCARCQHTLAATPLDLQLRILPGIIIASTSDHDGLIQRASVALKYDRAFGAQTPLSLRLVESVQELGWRVEVVIPAPMHVSRRRRRGYNQAEIIAAPVAQALGVAIAPDAITRNRATVSQVGLSSQERLLNVSGAFSARKSVVKGKTVLLIDDVVTTGATLAACAQAALAEGAAEVYGLTVTAAKLRNAV